MREDQITALLDVLGRIASALEVQAAALERVPQSVAERMIHEREGIPLVQPRPMTAVEFELMIHERNAAAQKGNPGCLSPYLPQVTPHLPDASPNPFQPFQPVVTVIGDNGRAPIATRASPVSGYELT